MVAPSWWNHQSVGDYRRTVIKNARMRRLPGVALKILRTTTREALERLLTIFLKSLIY